MIVGIYYTLVILIWTILPVVPITDKSSIEIITYHVIYGPKKNI